MQNNISYWEHSSFFADYDVIIIGSGIVGLSAALTIKLKAPSLSVGILEAGFLPSGASTKNAGFACFGSVSELIDEVRSTSEDEVLQVVEMRWKGLQKLKETLGEAAIDYHQLGGYEIFRHEDSASFDECIEKISYLNTRLASIIGRPDIYAVANERIAGFNFHNVGSMILNRCEAQIDAGKMMSALLLKVQETGVRIFNDCKVLNIHKEGSGHCLRTKQGSFKAQKVLIATNAFARDLFPTLDVIPGRGQVLVTAPIKGLKIKGTFHYDKGYYYFRNINDRILLGGGRNIDFTAEETLLPGTTSRVQSALESLLYQTIIPDQRPDIEFRWSGVMGFGDQLKPIIEQIEPAVFCAVRCNGMGVAMGSLTGQQAAELILQSV
ncbi:FAD-binding oxidoreductase [Flavihumibacter sp. R14]|nr:FAD-binding oxidoreductase [Flavihumibacter soli]